MKPRRIFLAAAFTAAEDMRRKRTAIQTLGHRVFGRWLDRKYKITDDDILAVDEEIYTDPATVSEIEGYARTYAAENVADLCASDLFIVQPLPESSTGGFHTEFGIFIGLEREIWIACNRRNVYAYLPGFRFFPTWTDVLKELAS